MVDQVHVSFYCKDLKLESSAQEIPISLLKSKQSDNEIITNTRNKSRLTISQGHTRYEQLQLLNSCMHNS